MDRQFTVMDEVKEAVLSRQADNSEAGQVPAPEALIYYRTTLLQATATQSEK